MQEYLPVIKTSPLFRGIADDEIISLLTCLGASRRAYEKNAFILRPGDRARSVCLTLSGSVHILKEDGWGNRNIIAEISPGELFAETYACARGAVLGVGALAAEKTLVLFMDMECLISTCAAACAFHTRLIQNFLAVLAEKNLQMNEKLTHLTQRTIRQKLLSYLTAESLRQGGPAFSIPFNRQQLADYLAADRSALSSALCKLRDDGLLEFEKNSFRLNKAAGIIFPAETAPDIPPAPAHPSHPGRAPRPAIPNDA